MKKTAIVLVALLMSATAVFAEKSEKEYLADLTPSKSEKEIVEAAKWVRAKEVKDAAPKLAALLKDAREAVRLESAISIGYVGEEAQVDAVNDAFLNDESATVRYAALLSSVRMASEKSIEAWKQARDKETDPYIKDFLTKMEEKIKESAEK